MYIRVSQSQYSQAAERDKAGGRARLEDRVAEAFGSDVRAVFIC